MTCQKLIRYFFSPTDGVQADRARTICFPWLTLRRSAQHVSYRGTGPLFRCSESPFSASHLSAEAFSTSEGDSCPDNACLSHALSVGPISKRNCEHATCLALAASTFGARAHDLQARTCMCAPLPCCLIPSRSNHIADGELLALPDGKACQATGGARP